jgi:hypothetical protein
MLFAESGSFWVIVDGYLSNPISTTELDMRISAHPAPREGIFFNSEEISTESSDS